MPLETKVLSTSELGLSIVEAEEPPDPYKHPMEANFQKAFAVRIPRIAANDTITFQVVTANSDNQRAGKQRIRIREEEFRVLLAFMDRVSKAHPEEVTKWVKDSVLNAHIKNESFFSPAYLSYEHGRLAVAILNEAEQIANAVNQDLYSKYKKDFIEVFQTGAEFKAPVIRIKTAQGESTTALFAPYVRTYIEASVAVQDLQKNGTSVPIPVPKQY